jgi:hypothetical protein
VYYPGRVNYQGQDNYHGQVKTMSPPRQILRDSRSASFEALVAEVFRKNGWQVVRQPKLQNRYADLLVSRDGKHYIVEVKAAAEGRRDRLIPLLAQAILQAQAAAGEFQPQADPLAIVVANRIPQQIWEESLRFAAEYAPNVAIGLVDLEGFRAFSGHDLEALNAQRIEGANRASLALHQRSAQLFSDLNQWMIKILLAPRIPERLISAPRGEYRNASELAKAAQVSIMSAFRFVSQFAREGFLDDSGRVLRLVRLEELMKRWQAANQLRISEFPMRFVIKGDKPYQLREALRSYQAKANVVVRARRRAPHTPVPRGCLGLFAAADMLGIGFVHGAPLHVYLEKIDVAVLRELGLSSQRPNESGADVYIRIPAAHESVFRAAVEREGIPVSDVLQVWLDVSGHPARGNKQAEEIRRRFLASVFRQD